MIKSFVKCFFFTFCLLLLPNILKAESIINQNNPKTFDAIVYYIVFALVGIMGIVGFIIYKRSKKDK